VGRDRRARAALGYEFRKIDPNLNQAILHMHDLPADRVLKAAIKLLAERASV
jgi:hypothetical protein